MDGQGQTPEALGSLLTSGTPSEGNGEDSFGKKTTLFDTMPESAATTEAPAEQPTPSAAETTVSPWAPPAEVAPPQAPVAEISLPPMPESLQPAAMGPVGPEASAAANVIAAPPSSIESVPPAPVTEENTGKFGLGVVESPMPPDPSKIPGWTGSVIKQ